MTRQVQKLPPKHKSRSALAPLLTLTSLEDALRSRLTGKALSDLLAGLRQGVATLTGPSGTKSRKSQEDALRLIVRQVLLQLDTALTSRTAASRRLRMRVIEEVARVEQAVDRPTAISAARRAHEHVTIEEAARILGVSRPHVSMLVEHGKLHATATSAHGKRQIPRSSVVAHKTAHAGQGSKDYKRAAALAGMYDIPDEVYVARIKKRSQQEGRG